MARRRGWLGPMRQPITIFESRVDLLDTQYTVRAAAARGQRNAIQATTDAEPLRVHCLRTNSKRWHTVRTRSTNKRTAPCCASRSTDCASS